jgi:O-antigen/teichoic acid export membrane protein
MFSDLGISPSIIQNKRGDDPKFLRTAWTLLVIRGWFMWFVLCLLSWPLSWIYHQPEMVKLLPVVGLNIVLGGFNSTAQYTIIRHIQLARLSLLEMGSQLGGVIVMLISAWLNPTVWAIVYGGLFASILKLALSYLLIPGIPHAFEWDKQSLQEIFHFGKWVFLSTIFTFLGLQGDRLLLGVYIPMEELGIYSIASLLSMTLITLIQNVSTRIQFPLYSRLASENHKEMPQKLLKTRFWINLIGLIPLIIFVACGDHLIHLLYDKRYYDAGLIFQILSFGSIGALFATTLTPIFLAVGNSYRHMIVMLCKAFFLLSALTIGGFAFGLQGAVFGIALSYFLFYGFVYYSTLEYKIKPLKEDLALFFSALILITLIWHISHGSYFDIAG